MEDEVLIFDPQALQQTSVKGYEIENILKLAEELLGDIQSSVMGKGHQYSYKIYEDESKSDVEEIIQKLKDKK